MLIDKLGKLREKMTNQKTKMKSKQKTKMALHRKQVNARAMHTISLVRGSKMRVELSFNFKTLYNPPEEEGTDLCGSNVTERIKELSEQECLVNQIAKTERFQRTLQLQQK